MNEFKKILKDVITITVIALGISILYNTINPLGINIFEKPKVVSDTVLQELLSRELPTRSEYQNNNEIISSDTQMIAKNDVLAKEDKSEAKQAVEPKEGTNNEIEQKGEILEITYEQLEKFLDNPRLILIDARSPEDFEKGHIGRAINIFAYDESEDNYFRLLFAVPRDDNRVIVVYCEGGTCDASHKVAKDLVSLGYKNVLVYSGGWEEWTKRKRR